MVEDTWMSGWPGLIDPSPLQTPPLSYLGDCEHGVARGVGQVALGDEGVARPEEAGLGQRRHRVLQQV